MVYWIELHSPGSLPLRHELLNTRMAVGTGSNANIHVLPSTGLAPIHFWVDPSEMGVKVTVEDALPIALHFEGREFRSITVKWGSEVFVGNMRVTFLAASVHLASKGTKLLLATAAVLGLAGIGMYEFQGWGTVSEPSSEAPALNDIRPAACPNVVATSAEQLAIENERAAISKQQRFPFDPRDGVEAVGLLLKSEACYRVADRIDEASRTHAAGVEWSNFMNSEYSSVRLQLKYAIEHDNYADAIRRIDDIGAFLTPHVTGDYFKWLTQTRAILTVRLAASRQ